MYLAKTLTLCHLPRGNLYFVQGVHVSGGNTFINHIMDRVFVQNYNFIWLFSIYINPEMDEGGELGVQNKSCLPFLDKHQTITRKNIYPEKLLQHTQTNKHITKSKRKNKPICPCR